jgi:hypothetical protein
VFDDVDAAGRRQQRRAGGEIEASRRITAGSDDVDRVRRIRNRGATRERAHRARESAQLGGRHALGPQRRE